MLEKEVFDEAIKALVHDSFIVRNADKIRVIAQD